MGSGVRTPQPFYWPPHNYCEHNFIDPNFNSGQSSRMFVWNTFIERSIILGFPFQINKGYTRKIDLKFEIPKKNPRRGSHRAPSPDHFPLFLGLCPRFGLRAWFRSPTFDAWLCPYHAWGRDLYVQHPLNERAKMMCLSSEFCTINQHWTTKINIYFRNFSRGDGRYNNAPYLRA